MILPAPGIDEHPAVRSCRSPIHTRVGEVCVLGQPLRVVVSNPGAGRPLLLLRGLGGTTDRWAELGGHLSDRETIAFDPPGLGGSPLPRQPRRMGWYADLAAAMSIQLGHGLVDVLGLSWGGAVAQEMARRHPGQVRRLVLAATSAGYTAVPAGPRGLVALGRFFRANPGELLRSTVIQPSGLLAQCVAMTGWTSLPWLRMITSPTLVVAGRRDRIIPSANARLLAAMLPHSRLHLVAEAGHGMLGTHTDEVLPMIKAFLDS